MTRTREEAVKRTFLDNAHMQINWPCRLVVALHFPSDVSPVVYVEGLLKKAGYASPEDAVQAYENLPDCLHYCHAYPLSESKRLALSPTSDAEFLRFALILGLCGPTYYDRSRPVIWTTGRLTRSVGLYLPRGFYAD